MIAFHRRTSQGVVQPLLSLALAAFVAWAAPACHGGLMGLGVPQGSQGFTDMGAAVASPTNDVNDATTFTIGELISTDESNDFFAGLPNQFFGPVTFTVTSPLSLTFGNAEFGTFASTSIIQLSNDPAAGSRSFFVEGTYTKGTFGGPLTPNPALATFTISFNQTGGTGSAISNNSTLVLQAVPEPGTWVLVAGAAATGIAVRGRRRSRA